MKVKIISGIVLMTLSSLSVAAGHSGTGTSVNDLSRSPFQADRDKVRVQSGQLTPTVSAPLQENPGAATVPSAGQAVLPSPGVKPVTSVYNPWLTMNLQESHLISLDIGTWAKAQGMHLLWNSNRDYLVYSTINLTGKNRDEVLSQLGQLFLSENYGLVVKLYEKNNVLVIDGQ
ncbi:TPA: TcpQ domain-containing protein [Salmonella enterica subsp. diarizonae serovar 48:i:z]|nr:TcpQ domain-containing protein [Salmonella enterica]MDJ6543275.1 toxin co-regulated pilus biosynthesis Q family protein [Salmonella enterica]MDJ7049695.1 toxin co-regulated pilus biosynthesis Q family protein [Salmonella enterica]MDJ7339137.1 toxin co-regulated pilus biosynthesis Q family protein [Salmonella enterica]